MKHAHCIGFLQSGINAGIACGKVSKIDFIAIVITDQFQRVLENGHHSQPQQVHFDDAHVRAIILVPLHDRAAGHCGPLEGNNRIQLPLTNHHAARVLAKMARQVLKAQTQVEELADTRLVQIETRHPELRFKRVGRIFIFPRADKARQAIERFRIEAKHLAGFTCGGPAAIRDDIGRHGGAKLAVSLIHVLDGALALIAAGQIQIDIGPLAAFFGKESLEKQLHSHGIDRRDTQCITNGAVGGRAAALHEDVVLTAELNDVPDDEEVSFEAELFNKPQLTLDLPARFLVIRPKSFASAFFRALAKE